MQRLSPRFRSQAEIFFTLVIEPKFCYKGVNLSLAELGSEMLK